eukprot:TCONS_00021447-protein
MGKCNVCDQPDSNRCSQCQTVYYCSKECQVSDWKNHKKRCKEISKEKKATQEATNSSFEQQILSFLTTKPSSNFKISEEYKRRYSIDRDDYSALKTKENVASFLLFNIKSGKPSMQCAESCDFTSRESILKRWGPNIADGERLSNFLEDPRRRFGDIYERLVRPNYATNLFQTMRNSTITNRTYEFGRTYVGFGFVDLFQLAWGKYKDTLQERLAFYGYDSNQFTTLRSKMIYGIMKYFKEDEISTSSLLQIWFSSCWSRETEKAFRLVSQDALKNPDKYQLQSGDADIIQKWLRYKISLDDAKSKFSREIKSVDRDAPFEAIWSMKLEEDRVKFLRYLYTGIIFVDESKISTGNPTMFYESPNNKRVTEESFFQSINLLASQFEVGRSNHKTMHELIISCTLDVMTGFRALIKSGNIQCYLETKFIDPIDLSFAQQIKLLSPLGINWSNIPDYMKPKEFIKFAKACSVDDTIHYLHFMNWAEFVLGACHVDWMFKQEECIRKCKNLKK